MSGDGVQTGTIVVNILLFRRRKYIGSRLIQVRGWSSPGLTYPYHACCCRYYVERRWAGPSGYTIWCFICVLECVILVSYATIWFSMLFIWFDDIGYVFVRDYIWLIFKKRFNAKIVYWFNKKVIKFISHLFTIRNCGFTIYQYNIRRWWLLFIRKNRSYSLPKFSVIF